ncbi:helix-turn-helix transcriptional regulator [Streptomonospora wellingtoniae]|uniref:Helix-turn-helix transcriptional regulator n=1 Tax=Streptomonospora wellingtoniae TaxID=3075544 RepID=A0ABU2KNT2_9ACTN|nr:helix-turn-helix transcriptional regulator [Streptomonospora sp. DSM 45055]MDT0300930.1 helix-turn-helix transcriptional regulator [Streptomonospora sp. DSM 45055]
MATTALGAALRRWRDNVSPQAVGLPAGGRRRAAGLRREELSQLAGVSADYIIRLEQGRATHPSPQVVGALARSLRLAQEERAHLFQLAGLAPPGDGLVPQHITPSVHRMLDRLTATPVAVFDAAWTQLLANPLYTALMGEWHGSDLNAVWRNFLSSRSRVRPTPGSQAELQAAQVADLRRTAGRYPGDPNLHALIAELRRRSTHFDTLWESGAVGRHQAARKTVDHPRIGALTLDCDVLSVAGSDLRIMVYTARPGTEDADRLALLDVIGTQALVEGPTGRQPGS